MHDKVSEPKLTQTICGVGPPPPYIEHSVLVPRAGAAIKAHDAINGLELLKVGSLVLNRAKLGANCWQVADANLIGVQWAGDGAWLVRVLQVAGGVGVGELAHIVHAALAQEVAGHALRSGACRGQVLVVGWLCRAASTALLLVLVVV